MLKEFKAFIFRGNVIDMAVGVIIAVAFGAIVNSLIVDIITPLILNPALEKAGVKDIAEWRPYGILLGKFLAQVLNFIVVAFILFLVIKGMNKAMSINKKEETPAAPAPTPEDILLLQEIRDLLKK